MDLFFKSWTSTSYFSKLNMFICSSTVGWPPYSLLLKLERWKDEFPKNPPNFQNKHRCTIS